MNSLMNFIIWILPYKMVSQLWWYLGRRDPSGSTAYNCTALAPVMDRISGQVLSDIRITGFTKNERLICIGIIKNFLWSFMYRKVYSLLNTKIGINTANNDFVMPSKKVLHLSNWQCVWGKDKQIHRGASS